MPIPRLFQNIALRQGETLSLSLSAAHYLGQVRRLRENDSVIVFNGQGGEYQARVQELKKDRLTVLLLSYRDILVESPLRIELAQGIARGEKMDLIIQKGVELGVQKIIPLFTERSNVKLDAEKSEKRRQHWQGVVVSACEQSGRAFVPQVTLPQSLPTWLKGFQGRGLTLSPNGMKTISSLEISGNLALTLLVGPEGGLTDAEITLAQEKNFEPLRLGPRILRTETAALTAIAALQARFGDLS